MDAENEPWAQRDRRYAAARKAVPEAVRHWRSLGGSIHVNGRENPRQGPDDAYETMDAARREYWEMSARAFPPNFAGLVEQLRVGSPAAIEPAIAWLEEDHFCRRSGYAKERIMRYLARSPLTEQ